MPSIFNLLRAGLYVTVLIWTVICLAIAAHFQSILISSDLTRFVPFAIFVCAASLLVFLALLGFSLWRDRNPISTRIELGCLGLAGVLWLALAAFVASSDADDADVECYSSSSAEDVVDVPGFNTETYHAQYRVLEAFSFFNVILIWGFFIFLLVLAVRRHRAGHKSVWFYSVTGYPWFAKKGSKSTGRLPAPVVARSKSRSRAAGAPVRVPTQEKHVRVQVDERPARAQGDGRTPPLSRQQSQSRRDRDDGRTQPLSRSQSQTRRDDGRTPPLSRQQSQARREREREREGDGRTPPLSRQQSQARREGDGRTPPLSRQHSNRHPPNVPTRNESPTYVYWIPHKEPDAAHVRDPRAPRTSRDKYQRDASPRR